MKRLTRRTTLLGISVGVAALAGCTGAGAPDGDGSDGDGTGSDSDGTGSDADDGSDGDDGTGSDADDGSDGDDGGGVETAVQHVGSALLRSEWDRTEQRGYCALIGTESDAERLLAEAPEPARAFVDETDFAESLLCYVESVGPTTCHDEIEFDGVAVEDGTLVADATVLGPPSDDVACGQAITYPAALLRVTSEPIPGSARLSVTDGWGETGTVRNETPE